MLYTKENSKPQCKFLYSEQKLVLRQTALNYIDVFRNLLSVRLEGPEFNASIFLL